jgi:hydroxyacylglutathione hydrolase
VLNIAYSHWDHTGGNQELKTKGVTVVGPAVEQEKIPGIDVTVQGGDCLEFGDHQVHVMDVGGHTRGHVAYYFEAEKKVFCGDALFVMGCGKMFEGTPTQFWQSLQRLRDLPEDALVYCAHEYTLSNAKFAVSVEPSNAELMQRYHQVQQQRSRGEPTVPTMIGLEKKTNPFLRVDVSDEIRSKLGVGPQDTHADAFAKVRRAKDVFRG